MKKVILLLFVLISAFALRAQHSTVQDSVTGKHKKFVYSDTIKPRNVFSVGMGMELKTTQGYINVGKDYHRTQTIPANEEKLIYRNSFVTTSPFALMLNFNFTDKKFNTNQWAIIYNPKKKHDFGELSGWTKANYLTSTYIKFQYSWARPYTKKSLYRNGIVPYYAFKSSFIYSLNKFYYSFGDMGSAGYSYSDESYVCLLSLTPSVKKTFKWITLQLSYDIALFGFSSINHHFKEYYYEYQNHDHDYRIESSVKKKEFIDPAEMFKSHLMFNNFNISLGFMFKPYPYKRFKVKKTEQ